MKTKKLLYFLPFIVALVHGKSVDVQSVIYSEGAVAGYDDDVPEDIPPRDQWFRVRGDRPLRNQHESGPYSQSMAHGDREIVELPPSGNRNPKRILAGAIGQQPRGDLQESRVAPANNPRGNSNNDRIVQAQVRNRGKVGLQSRSMKKESESDEDDSSSGVFTRRIGDREDDRANRPNDRVGRVQNARRVSGNNKAKSTKEGDRDVIVIEEERSQQQQPREPHEEIVEELVEDHNDHKQDEIVQLSGHPNDHRENDNENVEVEYEYDDVNDSRSRNRNSKPAQQARVGQRTVIKTSRDRGSNYLGGNSPPPHEQVAKMARYIVHNSNWSSISTISTMKKLKGYPFANIISVSDGPIDDSSGTPYMYMTPLDMSSIDLRRDPRASLTMSLAQSDYCKRQEYDPEDPRCAHVILSGKVIQVAPPDEKEFAMNAVFTRHPEMTDWPKDHGWYFAKLDIEHIVVLDYFGGAKTVSLDDYFNH